MELNFKQETESIRCLKWRGALIIFKKIIRLARLHLEFETPGPDGPSWAIFSFARDVRSQVQGEGSHDLLADTVTAETCCFKPLVLDARSSLAQSVSTD